MGESKTNMKLQNNNDNLLNLIGSGSLYPSTAKKIKQINTFKNQLKHKSNEVHPQYEETISKITRLFLKKLELLLESRDIEWEKRLIQKQFDENFTQNTYNNDLMRAELEKNLQTDEGRKLFQRLLTLEKANSDLSKQNERAKSILSNLRLNYFREINNLREMNQPWRTTQDINDYLQVRFFEPTEGIDKSIVEILNSKLLEMKKEYDKRLTILSDDCNEKAKKIQAYQELAPSSYGLLDMSLLQIIEGIRAMEKDPQKLWKTLTKVYTRQFFD